jgi:hypothetical protein
VIHSGATIGSAVWHPEIKQWLIVVFRQDAGEPPAISAYTAKLQDRINVELFAHAGRINGINRYDLTSCTAQLGVETGRAIATSKNGVCAYLSLKEQTSPHTPRTSVPKARRQKAAYPGNVNIVPALLRRSFFPRAILSSARR